MKLEKKNNPKKIYFIGVKGVGMTMLAQFLKAKGHEVSGSDVPEKFLTDQVLKKSNISVKSPFSPANIPSTFDKIVYSSAYSPESNPELAFIVQNPRRFKNKKIVSYAVALAETFNRHKGIAVCGSHGKTTTTAWLGYVLGKSGLDPNVLVGSSVPQFKGSGLSGGSKYMIAEVDEYQNKMQFFMPFAVVINNIDYDHPDFFKTEKQYLEAFNSFIKKIPAGGWLVANYQDKLVVKVAANCRGKVISYSSKPAKVGAEDYQAINIKQQGDHQIFNLLFCGQDMGEFSIKLTGQHNISNSLAVIAAAHEMKVPFNIIKKHLYSFRGTDRRGQILGDYKGALIIDDYAHHPAEVKATLSGFRDRWPDRRIITVFHPHTYSRTAALFSDFVTSFKDTDVLVVLDIYSSARETAGTRSKISHLKLAQAIVSHNKKIKKAQSVLPLSDLEKATEFLKKSIKSEDIVVLMGAGDVFRIGNQLLK